MILTAAIFCIMSDNHRLNRWLAKPHNGMLLAGLKAHRNFRHLQICPTSANTATIQAIYVRKLASE